MDCSELIQSIFIYWSNLYSCLALYNPSKKLKIPITNFTI